ncbi:hypothetical protein EsVE80_03110 [Enterococcus saigonensis]|uniref:Competence protein ComGD n=1 Tax=Enterococcus saigonensis TaxID=1805431 RepID=A0A679I5H0_9ENTE|nr:competence type IV pilus minor pilin ComGD [Enterococcus saigonensis]BCA84788.1 hypothetical protein EsVE80_03110 [Enterococcus saigonensis]
MKNIMMRLYSNASHTAFTIAESLVVLVVITAFLLIPTLTLQPLTEKMRVELFLAEFEQNFLLLQQTAIAQQVATTLEIDRQDQVLQFKISEQKSYPHLQIPSELSCVMPDKINIKENTGNYSQMETITFKWKNRKLIVKYTFQMGSGRFVKSII